MRRLMATGCLLLACVLSTRASTDFIYTLGGSAPPSQTILVTFSGFPFGTTLWVNSPAWLNVSPGSCYASGSCLLTVSLRTQDLMAGVYGGSVGLSGTVSLRYYYRSVTDVTARVIGPPAVSPGGIVDAASFRPGLVAGNWASIFGQGLAITSFTGYAWKATDIVGGTLPTTLEGVSVRINGKLAALCFVSPGQLNVQAPDDDTVGPVPVEVKTPYGTSQASVELRSVAPALFARSYANQQKPYLSAAAAHLDGTLVGDTEDGKGARGAKPGEIIMLFGTGFGKTAPARPAGRLVDPAPLAQPVQVYIGDVPAEVRYGGLVSPGLYQFNVVVPQVPPRDHWVVVEIEGQRTQPGVALTIVQ